ncbi:cell adhesion protein byn-1 [Mycena filopes]|nr:cell adhesion protein byn-1 [Mycena filopes]
MPRVPSAKSTSTRHANSLHSQITGDQHHATYGTVSLPRRKQKNSSENNEELGACYFDEEEDDDSNVQVMRTRVAQGDFDDGEEDENAGDTAPDLGDFADLDPQDMETLDSFLPPNSEERKTLADVIFAKLNAADNNVAVVHGTQTGRHDPAVGLDPKVVAAYSKLGLLLTKYKANALPKLFKVIPSLPAWARILALTAPENWSPHACRAATRVFIPQMKSAQAQLFLNVVLLNAVREDIQENKKLNVQYYEALMRALYKPAAFFKGIVFPLLEEGCTLREAVILSSVLSKVKIPVLHASAALLRIADMEYAGPNSLLIRVLLDKKYSLPYKVVDSLVFHFIRISNAHARRGISESLPVLWHQSLLVFVQRYASDLTQDQKDAVLDVVRVTPHPQISADVRREITAASVRGDAPKDIEMFAA